MPRIQNFTFKIISTTQQADELADEGFEFHALDGYRDDLNRGVIAFCVFVGRELVHIGWVAMTEEAKKSAEDLPYRVVFSNKVACTGGTRTIPKYRGNGLMAYGYFKRFRFLKERGILTSRNAVNAENIVSQKVHAKFGPKIHAKARHIRILKWQLWIEKPLDIDLST